MKRLFLLVLLLAAGVGCYQPSSPSIAQPANPSPNVEIKIESNRRTFRVGEPITVTITIKNLTSNDLDAPETYWSATVVLDGKEFKRLPQYIGMWNGPGVILRNRGQMGTVLTLSEYGISQEFLTVGEHSMRVKIGDDLSNTLVITTVESR